MFTWKPIYRELAERLMTYRDRQKELIAILASLQKDGFKVVSLKDKVAANRECDLEEIDPFTFFASFNRGTNDEKRIGILRSLKELLKLVSDLPTDFSAIPVVYQLQSWFFPWKYERKADDITCLWEVAAACLSKIPGEMDPNLFERCLQIDSVSSAKLTIGMFWFNPDQYLPLDSRTVSYLTKENISVPTGKNLTLADYTNLIHAVSEHIGSDFVDISYRAFKAPEGASQRYWAGGFLWGGKESHLDEFVRGGFWQHGYERQRTEKAAQEVWNLFDQIRPGDEFAIKGMGGKSDLKIHFIGKVTEVIPDEGKVLLTKLERPLYDGKGPKGAGVGNWFNTLLEVKRPDLVKQFFGTGRATNPLNPTSETPSLNLILYGPPGTGKTYQTIRRAVALIDDTASAEDESVKKRFDQLVDQSRIGFVAFHQSYSYEDFVEGIRPVMDDEGATGIPRYECRDGIFKRMCALARSDTGRTGAVEEADWANLRVWKMSLGNTLNPEEAHIFEDCIKGGFIAHGAGRGRDFTKDGTADDIRKSLEQEEWTNWPSSLRHHIGQIQALRNDLREGDIVVVSYGNHYFRAIGRVAGDYRFNRAYEYPQTRPVKWLRVFEEPQPKERLLRGKAFSQLTLYPLSIGDLKMDALRELLSAQGKASPGRYVLIIDEINRGNISKILGELITLIDPDKRRGQPHALTVTLPYSQQPFSVPDNLYILGTMNTADKSIALVDVALRRRFQFKELMPDLSLCTGLTAEMRTVLLKLNQRIVVQKDRDHQIGHAYFMGVHNEAEFNKVFARQIMPLLQEYFYNDWEGLRYVLGEEGTAHTFITAVKEGDCKGARTRWQWAAEIEKIPILKQLAKNYSAGAPTDDQTGQATN